MRAPRRYRICLRAYPREYLRENRAEIEGTLLDLDDARGRPSTREALALALGGARMRILRVRTRRVGTTAAAIGAGLTVAVGLLPAAVWASETSTVPGVPVIHGPTTAVRAAMLGAGALLAATLVSVAPWCRARDGHAVAAAGAVAAALVAAMLLATRVRAPASGGFSAFDALLASGVGVIVGATTSVLARLSRPVRLTTASAGCMTAVLAGLLVTLARTANGPTPLAAMDVGAILAVIATAVLGWALTCFRSPSVLASDPGSH